MNMQEEYMSLDRILFWLKYEREERGREGMGNLGNWHDEGTEATAGNTNDEGTEGTVGVKSEEEEMEIEDMLGGFIKEEGEE